MDSLKIGKNDGEKGERQRSHEAKFLQATALGGLLVMMAVLAWGLWPWPGQETELLVITSGDRGQPCLAAKREGKWLVMSPGDRESVRKLAEELQKRGSGGEIEIVYAAGNLQGLRGVENLEARRPLPEVVYYGQYLRTKNQEKQMAELQAAGAVCRYLEVIREDDGGSWQEERSGRFFTVIRRKPDFWQWQLTDKQVKMKITSSGETGELVIQWENVRGEQGREALPRNSRLRLRSYRLD